MQDLLPIRYGRMLVSPFTFYRGAAAVMAADLAPTPTSGIIVQACGDAHISNFGGFAAPDRRLIFGPNDFDETLPGPWEWDVKRMAASAEIAGRDIGPACRGSAAHRRGVRPRVPRGDARLREGEPSRGLVRPFERQRAGGSLWWPPRQEGCDRLRQPFAKARRKNHLRAVTQADGAGPGRLRFRSVPPLLVPLRDVFDTSHPQSQEDWVQELMDQYAASLDDDRRYLFSTYRFVDMARKVVGVGSVGTRALCSFSSAGTGRIALGAAGQGSSGLGSGAVPGFE